MNRSEVVPAGQLPRDIRPLGYSLDLEIIPSRPSFYGRVRIRVAIEKSTTRVWLHGLNLRVTVARAEFANHVLLGRYTEPGGGVARLDFGRALPPGEAVLDLTYQAPYGRSLLGLYKVTTGGDAYAFTQFEPTSARLAFPCFDEPGFKTPFDVRLTVPDDQVAISNMPEIRTERTMPGVKRVHFATTRPLPTYLVAFAVGPLDVVQTAQIPPNEVRKWPLPLRGIAARGKGALLGYALEQTPALVTDLERYLGIEFPFPKLDLIAVPEFLFGAMENAGAITFREEALLLDPRTAGDAERQTFDHVAIHELAHHWFGDLVTMRWWDDLWLNEGLATWIESRSPAFPHRVGHPANDARSEMFRNMDLDSRLSSSPVRHAVMSTLEASRASYSANDEKAAAVLAMFEGFVGPEALRRGLHDYLRSHAYGSVTTVDLLTALGQASRKDVATPMSTFLDQPGVPSVAVGLTCPPDPGKRADIRLSQTRYLPPGSTAGRGQLWQIPVCIRYQLRGDLHETCTLLTAPDMTLTLAPPGCPDWMMPNANGAGYYRWTLQPAAFAALQSMGFPRLTPAEKQSFVDTLRVGLSNGALSAELALSAFPTLAADHERTIATMPGDFLGFVRRYMLSDQERPSLDRFETSLYRERLQTLGWHELNDDDADTKALRAALIRFLAKDARDPVVRAKAAELGRRYAAVVGSEEAESVPRDVRDVALQVAMQEGDTSFWDGVYHRLLATRDQAERYRLIIALASVGDDRSRRALALTLDPALRVEEVLIPLQVQLIDEQTRDAAWSYLEQNYDAIVRRIQSWRAVALPGMATSFCSSAMAEHVQAFFTSRLAKLYGGQQHLAAIVEGMKVCAAKVDIQRQEFRAAFSKTR